MTGFLPLFFYTYKAFLRDCMHSVIDPFAFANALRGDNVQSTAEGVTLSDCMPIQVLAKLVFYTALRLGVLVGR